MIKLQGYRLKSSGHTVEVAMPRRARVLGVSGALDGVYIHTQCAHDDNTAAFDVESSRTFGLLKDGEEIPAGAQYLGTCSSGPKMGAVHVFELPRVKPHGL